ncbi:MAG: tyrosine-type recombinase/integrase [Mesorhizobium sp.]
MASIVISHRPQRQQPFQVYGYTLVDGNKVSLPGKSFATRKAAEVYRAELLLMADRDGGLADPSHFTFAGFLDHWLKNHPRPLSVTTRGGYEEHIRRVKPLLGKIPLAKLRAGDLDRAYGKLLREGGKPRSLDDIRARKTKALSTTTVNNLHRCLKTALRQGYKWGYVATNVADRATPPPIRRAPQVRAYEANERARLLAASETSSYPFLPALLKLLGMTGARRSEAIGIAVSDIDFDARTITIRRTIVQVGRRVLVREGVGKSVTSMRRLHLPDELIPVLRQQVAAVSAEALKVGADYVRTPLLLFPGPGGHPLRPNSLSTTLRRNNRAAGVEAPPVHTLRHTTATVMIGAGVDIATVAAQLGHASPAITARIYLHADEERSRAGAATLGGIFEQEKKP